MSSPRHSRLALDRLEERAIPAVAANFSFGVLRVTGSDAAETIQMRQTGEGRVVLYAPGMTRTYTGVREIYADGRGGNDYISLDTSPLGTNQARLAVKATLIGGYGNDTLIGGANGDMLYGNAGNDQLFGNAGNDWLYGGDGRDTLNGGTGSDLVSGEGGDDRVYGSSGNDRLNGGAGTDFVDGGTGTDVLQGGSGFDTFKNYYGEGDLLDEADPEDVRQGMSGTCVILASLQAAAEEGYDLASRIRQVNSTHYSVPIYRPGTGWISQIVYYDGSWTDNDPAPAADGNPWVLIYQRAYLQEMGVNWADPNSAGWAARYGGRFQLVDSAFRAVLGRSTYVGSRAGGLIDSDLAQLRANYNANRPTIVLSRPYGSTVQADMNRLGVITSHAYSLAGFGYRNGQTTVKLRNPWGTDGPVKYGVDDGIIELSWGDFRRVMLGFCMA